MRELGEALRPHPDSGIGTEELGALSNRFSSFSDDITVKSPPPGAEIGRIYIQNCRNSPIQDRPCDQQLEIFALGVI